MQATDTRSPTALRSRSVVETPAHTTIKVSALVFGLLMLATTLAFGLTPAASAVTALGALVALAVLFAITEPIIRWIADSRR